MKRIIPTVLLILALATNLLAADAKITAMTATTTPAPTDIIPIVVDPSGTPLNRKVTVGNLFAISGLTLTAPKFNSFSSVAGQTLAGSATISAQGASAIAGSPITLTASNAVAGSSNAGAAAGGSVTITAGDAARLTSGTAAGGSISLVPGSQIPTGGNTPQATQAVLIGGLGDIRDNGNAWKIFGTANSQFNDTFGFYVNAGGSYTINNDIALRRPAAGMFDISSGVGCGTPSNCRDLTLRHIVASGAAPTIASGFAASGSSVSKAADMAGSVTVGGTTPGNTGTVTFGVAFTSKPSCQANNEGTAMVVQAVPTTSVLVLNGFDTTTGLAKNFTAGDVISWHCGG